MERTEKECRNPECNNKFIQYKTTDKYCSGKCAMKCKKPNLQLKPIYKPIKKVSDKRKIENLKYSAARVIFLGKPENRICPITGLETTEIHHMKGRIGELFLDERYWLAVSREGHQQIENNPEWAKEYGYSLERLKTENKAQTLKDWRICTPKTVGELKEALKCYSDNTEILFNGNKGENLIEINEENTTKIKCNKIILHKKL